MWWLIPTFFSALFAILALINLDYKRAYDYGRIGKAFRNLMIIMAAAIPSLLIWLIYLIVMLLTV